MAILIILLFSVMFILFGKLILPLFNKRNQKHSASPKTTPNAVAPQPVQHSNEDERMKPQKDLILRYAQSDLTAKLLFTIGDHDPINNPPDEILIYNDRILGRYKEKTIAFDFAEHRVFAFEPVIWTGEYVDLKYVVKPQISMAQAINILLQGKYHISDQGRENYSHKMDDDGKLYTTVTYISDHVVMKLKSTMPNRSF